MSRKRFIRTRTSTALQIDRRVKKLLRIGMSDEEISKIINFFVQLGSANEETMFLFLLLDTGLRINEALSIML